MKSPEKFDDNFFLLNINTWDYLILKFLLRKNITFYDSNFFGEKTHARSLHVLF